MNLTFDILSTNVMHCNKQNMIPQYMSSFAKESSKDIVQAECLLYECVKRVQVSFVKYVLLIGKNN